MYIPHSWNYHLLVSLAHFEWLRRGPDKFQEYPFCTTHFEPYSITPLLIIQHGSSPLLKPPPSTLLSLSLPSIRIVLFPLLSPPSTCSILDPRDKGNPPLFYALRQLWFCCRTHKSCVENHGFFFWYSIPDHDSRPGLELDLLHYSYYLCSHTW